MKWNGSRCAALATLALISCGRSSGPSSSFAPVGPLGIVATLPANGTTDIAPTTTLTITFASPQELVDVQQVAIVDGGARLTGTFVGIAPTNVWRWQPRQELPRGASIEVRVPVGADLQTVATFTVREANAPFMTSVLGTFASGVRTWPSGKRAVLSGGSTFEVQLQDGEPVVVQQDVVIPSSAWTYGDGQFAFTAPEGALLPQELVRRDLSGNEERVPMAYQVPIRAHNENGDVVIFVPPGASPTANGRGIWRLREDSSQWEWVGPLETTIVPEFGIDAAGNVAAAYIFGAELVIEHFVVGNLVPQRYTMPRPEGWLESSFDLAEDGTGIYAWRAEQFHVARFVPGNSELETVALPRPIPNLNQLFNVTTTNGLDSVQAIDGGTAVLYSLYSQSSFELFLQGNAMQRLAADDSVLPFETTRGYALFEATERESRATLHRGEVWSIIRPANNDSTLEIERSRPGKAFEPLLSLADYAPAGTQIQSIFWSIDDSGRAILAINEVGSPDARVFVIE